MAFLTSISVRLKTNNEGEIGLHKALSYTEIREGGVSHAPEENSVGR